MADSLEARFEAQLEELQERLQQCQAPEGEESAARAILEQLITGYRSELAALRERNRRGGGHPRTERDGRRPM